MVIYYSYCKVKGIGIRKLIKNNTIVQNISQIISFESRRISEHICLTHTTKIE